MAKTKQGSVVGWRLPKEITDAVAEYAAQTRRSRVGAAIVLLEAALKAASRRGEYTPGGGSEQHQRAA